MQSQSLPGGKFSPAGGGLPPAGGGGGGGGGGNSSTYPVLLQVADGRGGFAQQTYTITVNPTGYDLPPYFTSTPVVSGVVGVPYSYPSQALDPNGFALTYSVVAGSSPAGMTINATSGLVQWTPTPAQLGTNLVTLKATDTAGLFATQVYDVVVTTPPNDAVYITSTAVTSRDGREPLSLPGHGGERPQPADDVFADDRAAGDDHQRPDRIDPVDAVKRQ